MRLAPHRALVVLVLALSIACGKSKTEPSPTPTPTPTPTTRIIVIVGSLNFGDIPINTSADAQIQIRNDGTGPLTITSITGPSGAGSAFTTSFPSGTIAARSTQNVLIRFTPTEPRSYSGNMTVNSDATSGQNTQPIQAAGTAPIFTRTGVGDTAFEIPLYIQRLRVIGVFQGFSSNFIVRVGGRLVVNELLGTGWFQTVYDATLPTGGGGLLQITNSGGVAWGFTEVR